MKNKFWKLSINYIIIAFISIFLSVLIVFASIWATYKMFNLEELRRVAQWLYRISDIYIISYTSFFIVLPIIPIAVVINYLLTRRTTRRMNAILNAVIQVQKGKYNILLPDDNNEPLGELEQSINSLAIQINDTLNQLKKNEQSKDDFIVNIAHDLRTPLTSIIGYLSFISEKQLDPEISSKYAEVAFEKSLQLERLIESLFDIARLTMDEIHINKEELNLYKFLLQKQDEFYPQLHNADMEIRLFVSESASKIYADGAFIARVFDNLINNAIRYAKTGRYIDIKAESPCDKIRISFITHANPVPADELERIFDKLYRHEKSRTEGSGGIGLGLSISRRIIELHGGTIAARQCGSGTAFDIYLPKQII